MIRTFVTCCSELRTNFWIITPGESMFYYRSKSQNTLQSILQIASDRQNRDLGNLINPSRFMYNIVSWIGPPDIRDIFSRAEGALLSAAS